MQVESSIRWSTRRPSQRRRWRQPRLLEHVPTRPQIRHVVRRRLPGPRHLPRRRMEPLRRLPPRHHVRLHGGHDAPRLRDARQGVRARGHVGRRAGCAQSGFAALRHADAVRDTIIVVLAALKFVNETLVFAVVTCVLLFIYMLTLFESRKQVFLPARSTRNHALKEPFY